MKLLEEDIKQLKFLSSSSNNNKDKIHLIINAERTGRELLNLLKEPSLFYYNYPLVFAPYIVNFAITYLTISLEHLHIDYIKKLELFKKNMKELSELVTTFKDQCIEEKNNQIKAELVEVRICKNLYDIKYNDVILDTRTFTSDTDPKLIQLLNRYKTECIKVVYGGYFDKVIKEINKHIDNQQ